jgi:putative membrane protein
MSKYRLYLIGLLMGIADLIPGVSGGTIAFLCGIYEDLLASIKTLQFQSLKKIAWPFLLPLTGGIATSILLFSKLIYLLLLHYRASLMGLFFGLVTASTLVCLRDAKVVHPSRVLLFLIGAALSYTLTVLPSNLLFGTGFFGLVLAGLLGTGVMLLPGISGSFFLQVIGVYPLVLYALTTPWAPSSLKILAAMAIGVALGFIVFSRLIGAILSYFPQLILPVLAGFMAGGLKALWPFEIGNLSWSISFALMGFFLVICVEIVKRSFPRRKEL